MGWRGFFVLGCVVSLATACSEESVGVGGPPAAPLGNGVDAAQPGDATSDAPDATTRDGDGPAPSVCLGKEDGVPCEDGDICTVDDVCSGGLCVGGSTRQCDDMGPCSPGTCEPDQGCVYTPLADGATCSVGCFGAASCQGGSCVVDPDTAVVCPEPEEPCVAQLGCDQTTGACTVPIYHPEGTSCDMDENVCTEEVCDGQGACVDTGVVETCEAENGNNPCWTYTCTPKTGCITTLFIEGGSCNDGNPCTSTDTCIVTDLGQEACLGTPLNVDDGNPCTDDVCEAGVISHLPLDGASCETGDACTPLGLCTAGVCEYAGCACEDDADCEQPANKCDGVVTCQADGDTTVCKLDPASAVDCAPATEPCLSNVCEPDSGSCITTAATAGTGCDDGDACTQFDQCLNGACGGVAVTCNDGDPCTDDSCVAPSGCVFVDNDACEEDPCANGGCPPQDCEPVVYGHAGQGTNNGWTCDDVCGQLGGVQVNWTGVDEQLAYCHSLVDSTEDIMVSPNNHSYPLYDRQNDKHMCKVNANGWGSTANWAGNGTPDYGDTVLCRCQVQTCPCEAGCGDLQCGVDACGNDCGECAEGVSCFSGNCGCDGVVCGVNCCADGQTCDDGACVAAPSGFSGLVFSNLFNDKIYRWSETDGVVQIGSCGQPAGVAFVPPNLVYAACIASDSVERITLEGQQTTVHVSDSAFFNARAIDRGPDGFMYVASSTVTPTHVWRVHEDTKTVSPYSTIGVQEAAAIAFAPDGALFWADFKDGGFVFREPQGGGSTQLIDFPSTYNVRDLTIGHDGLVYMVGTDAATGLRVHQQDGSHVETLALPGEGWGVDTDANGDTWVMIGSEDAAIYKRDGQGWDLVTEIPTGIGSLRVVP